MEKAKPDLSLSSAELPRPVYPAIEAFIESASEEQVSTFFRSLKENLANLKGPRVEQAKKVGGAIQAVEELLFHLLEIREKLQVGDEAKR